MVRNGFRSNNGRSAIARRSIFGATGRSNGFMPAGFVTTTTGERIRARYFGGNSKGGSQPNATGFMIANGSPAATQVGFPAQRPNFLFRFRTQPGGGIWTYGPYAGG